jgi:hypothetical protein
MATDARLAALSTVAEIAPAEAGALAALSVVAEIAPAEAAGLSALSVIVEITEAVVEHATSPRGGRGGFLTRDRFFPRSHNTPGYNLAGRR